MENFHFDPSQHNDPDGKKLSKKQAKYLMIELYILSGDTK